MNNYVAALQIIVGFVLILTLIYETRQYQQFIVARKALESLGMGMQEGFNEIVPHLNSQHRDIIGLKQSQGMSEEEIRIIRTILDVHSEALEIKTLRGMFDRIDALKEKDDDE